VQKAHFYVHEFIVSGWCTDETKEGKDIAYGKIYDIIIIAGYT